LKGETKKKPTGENGTVKPKDPIGARTSKSESG